MEDIEIIKISLQDFKKDIYNKYIRLFPSNEQRDWKKVVSTYNRGIECFYKIVLDNKVIGFFMLESLENHPIYIDYFAIFKEFQNKGYGTLALKKLLSDIAFDKGVICEIEQENTCNILTTKRLNFYKSLGFEKFGSLYVLYDVFYTPLIYNGSKKFSKREIDRIFFDYYLINCGEIELKKNCKIIK